MKIKRTIFFLGSLPFTLWVIAFLLISIFYLSLNTSFSLEEQIKSYPFLFLIISFGFLLNLLFAMIKHFPWKRYHYPLVFSHVGLLLLLIGGWSNLFWGEEKELFLVKDIPVYVETIEQSLTLDKVECKGPSHYVAHLKHQSPLSSLSASKISKGRELFFSQILSDSDGALEGVHLTLRYEPAKYLCIYSGGIFLILGILLLSWQQMRKYEC